MYRDKKKEPKSKSILKRYFSKKELNKEKINDKN